MKRIFSKFWLSDNNNATEKSFSCQKLSLVIILIFVFLLSFGLWQLRLDFHSLWYDEANTVYLLQDKSVSEAFGAIVATSGSETLHPLYYLVLSAWMQIAGNSEWALRFPSVVFGSCAALVYTLLLYQVGGRKAIPFGFLLVVSPFLMWYSRDARPYTMIMFLTGLHLLCYLKLLAKPKSKKLLVGFIVTGVLSIYAGIFIGMLLAAEFFWGGFVRRKTSETTAMLSIIVLVCPLVWHGLQTHFVKSSDHYSELPKGMNVVRTLAIPQEFLVGRSLGPAPDEVRRLPLREIIRNKPFALAGEVLAIMSIVIAFLVTFRSFSKNAASQGFDRSGVHAVGFVTIACIAQMTLFILLTGYRMNARHLAFLFGPLFILGVLPLAYSNKSIVKIAFVMPLLALWIWSCANQIFDQSYQTENFRGAARIIKNDEHDVSQILALCHPKVLGYYGIDKPLVYFHEAADLRCDTLTSYLTDNTSPAWLILSRPWNYPNFHAEELEQHFQVLQTKQLPGISMWLLSSHD